MMELHKRDMILQLLQKTLRNEQTFQMENMKQVANDVRENQFLGVIKADYKKHFDFMLRQKRAQEKQLSELLTYLHKSAKQAEITQNLLLQTKGEQHRLLEEIEQVRREIDILISENNGFYTT